MASSRAGGGDTLAPRQKGRLVSEFRMTQAQRWVGPLGILAGALLLFHALFPQLAGIVLGVDDFGWIYQTDGPDGPRSLSEGLRGVWDADFFRPLDVFAGWFVDASTRDARPALWLHWLGVAAMLAALRTATRRIAPDAPEIFPLAVIVFGLHAATSLSLWQFDTASQVWSGAAGAWLGLTLWSGIERARRGDAVTRQAWTLAALAGIGPLCKETFFGWWGGACALLALLAIRARLGPRSAGWWALAAGVGILPAVYLALRLTDGGLGSLMTSGHSRYGMGFGANVPRNVVLALGGFWSTGPSHALLGLPGASLAVRAAAPLAIAGCALLAVAPLVLSRIVDPRPVRPTRSIAWIAAGVAFLGVTSFPIGRVSELYLMGPNLGASILVALGISDGARILAAARAPRSRVEFVRGVFIALIACVALLSAYGLTSRARHAALSWHYGRALYTAVRQHQDALAVGGGPSRVFVPPRCGEGGRYSQIVVPPAVMLNPKTTLDWLNGRHPGRPLEAAPADALPKTGDLVLPCAALPIRPQW